MSSKRLTADNIGIAKLICQFVYTYNYVIETAAVVHKCHDTDRLNGDLHE